MRFMVIVKASKESEAGVLPSQELLAEMGRCPTPFDWYLYKYHYSRPSRPCPASLLLLCSAMPGVGC
jgi:hypothetical protein